MEISDLNNLARKDLRFLAKNDISRLIKRFSAHWRVDGNLSSWWNQSCYWIFFVCSKSRSTNKPDETYFNAWVLKFEDDESNCLVVKQKIHCWVFFQNDIARQKTPSAFGSLGRQIHWCLVHWRCHRLRLQCKCNREVSAPESIDGNDI